jgi:hypothetical protein
MRFLLILSMAVLAGCATGPSRSQILAGLVGHSEGDAMRVLGAPNQIYQANGNRFLAYVDQSVGYGPAPGFAPWGPLGYGYFGFPPTVAYPRSCVMTLDVTGGVVRSWTMRGDC